MSCHVPLDSIDFSSSAIASHQQCSCCASASVASSSALTSSRSSSSSRAASPDGEAGASTLLTWQNRRVHRRGRRQGPPLLGDTNWTGERSVLVKAVGTAGVHGLGATVGAGCSTVSVSMTTRGWNTVLYSMTMSLSSPLTILSPLHCPTHDLVSAPLPLSQLVEDHVSAYVDASGGQVVGSVRL